MNVFVRMVIIKHKIINAIIVILKIIKIIILKVNAFIVV